MIGSIRFASSFPLRSATHILLPWNQWAKWFERNTTAHESRQSQLSWTRIRILLCCFPFRREWRPPWGPRVLWWRRPRWQTERKRQDIATKSWSTVVQDGQRITGSSLWCTSDTQKKPNGKQDGRCLKNKPLDGCTRFVLRFATCTREISATRRSTVIAVESLFDTIWLSLSSYSPNT